MLEIVPGEVGAHHVRLAISPLEEVLNAVRTLHRPSPIHATWASQQRDAVDVPELVTLTTGDTYFPDFLSPPVDDVEKQLAAITETPAEQVRLEIDMATEGRDVPPFPDPARTRDLLANQMRTSWKVLVEPIWPRLKDILDADIDFRTRRFRDGGLAAVLASIHPDVTAAGPTIRIPTVYSGHLALDSRGLQLIPSVFAAKIGVMMVPPWQPSLIYPARGSATLWESTAASPVLASVVGRTKALLLQGLDAPASTTTLARRLGVAASTINAHLKALTAAGLLSSRRAGRSVEYRRSPLGDELLSSSTRRDPA
jgi:biotin operon repressor